MSITSLSTYPFGIKQTKYHLHLYSIVASLTCPRSWNGYDILIDDNLNKIHEHGPPTMKTFSDGRLAIKTELRSSASANV